MLLGNIQIREGTHNLWFLTHLISGVASAGHSKRACSEATSLPPHSYQYLLFAVPLRYFCCTALVFIPSTTLVYMTCPVLEYKCLPLHQLLPILVPKSAGHGRASVFPFLSVF